MALKAGDRAPELNLVDTEKKVRSLREFLGKKTVIVFYPAAFTRVCSAEMCTFRDSLTVLNGMDAQVIAISVDPPFSNKAFAEQNKLNFPVLSDFTRHVTSQYCGLHMDFSGIPGFTAAKRSVFVLDKDGIVTYAWISDNPGIEPNYEEVKKVLSSM